MTKPGDLWTLAITFGILSLFAVGGAVSAIPEMQRIAVDQYGWMTETQFNNSFAISQLSPGPNVLIVTLIGYHVAGIAGGLIATLAMCGPTAIVAGLVGSTFQRAKDAEWARVIQAALVPISLGLMCAASLILALGADTSWLAAVITLGSIAVMLATKINPIWVLLAGGVAGAAGLV